MPDDDTGDRGGKWTRLLPGRAICYPCPVRAHCLAYAIQHAIEYGVWGGLDGSQRARMVRTLHL